MMDDARGRAERLNETCNALVNFARWARSGRGGAATCYSAEGRYRPELLRGDTLDDRRNPLPPIDVRDALLVFRAIGPAHGFPAKWYLAISAEFIWRLEGWQFVGYMRRHGYPISRRHEDIERLVGEAVAAAGNAIDKARGRAREVA